MNKTENNIKEALNSRLRMKRALKYGAVSKTITVGVVLIIILLNIVFSSLANSYNLAIDFSSNELYDISKSSKRMLENIDEEINVYVMLSRATAENSSEYISQVAKTIEAYGRNSDKINIEFIDLSTNPSFASKYSEYDLETYDVVISGKGLTKVVSMNDMLNYTIDSNSGSYTIKSSSAEQVMSNAIAYVNTGVAQKVQFIKGYGEEEFTSLKTLLSANNCQIEEVNILNEELESEKMAIWYGPSMDPSEESLKRIDSFLNAGGNLFIFLSPSVTHLSTLEAFMEEWGLSMLDGVAFETNYNYILSSNRYIPIISSVNSELSDEKASINKFIVFPGAKPLTLLWHQKDDITTTEILKLSNDSGWHSVDVAPDFKISESDITGNVNVMVMAERKTQGFVSHVVVVGSTAAFSSEYLTSANYYNAEYLVSFINTVTDNDFISIPAKNFDTGENSITFAQILFASIVFVILIPLVTISTGAVIWIKRKNL